MIAFLVLMYGVYMVAMIVCGVGLVHGPVRRRRRRSR